MAKHHIVQAKYLAQWQSSDTRNQLNIYFIPENKYIERGTGWKGFWRKDFNTPEIHRLRRWISGVLKFQKKKSLNIVLPINAKKKLWKK